MIDRPMKISNRFLRFLQAFLLIEMVILAVSCSITDYDGFVMATASATANGLIPFVDFPFAQGPLLAYLYAPFILLFGPELLPTRLFGLVFSWLLYLLTLRTAVQWFTEDPDTKKDARLISVVITLMWILYPEFLGMLPRIGSKESVASFLCIMSICGPFMFPKKRWHGLLISALFVVLSIGMKYTMIVLIPPLTLLLLVRFGWRETLFHLVAIGTGCFLIFSPYILTGNTDYLIANFDAPKVLVNKIIQRDQKASNLFMYVALTAWPSLYSLMGASLRYQLILIPSLAFFLHDMRSQPWGTFLRKKETFIALTFIYLCATASLITPAMHRIYMFVPLLLIFGAISWTRLVLIADKGLPINDFIRKERIPLSVSLILLLAINTVFLFKFNDGGFAYPNFATLRLPADKKILVNELNKICKNTPKEVLYVGEFQDRILSSKCPMSPYSIMSYPYLPLDTHYPLKMAEKYKFLTQEFLLDRMRRREYEILVFDNIQIKDGVDYYGVDYGAIKKTLNANYNAHVRTNFISIYTTKSGKN